MKIIEREDLQKEYLPGRMIQKAVGKDAYSQSGKMTMGFALYSEQSGPMDPHHHAEEIVHILNTKDGWVRFGEAPSKLSQTIPLKPGMTLHFPALEWHVFEFKPGGYIDIIYIYGQTDNIRPEEILREEK